METGMIVEKRELCFLLACKGLRNCLSLFAAEESGKPEEILENLFRKGWITNTGERFQVERKLSEAIRQIAEAKTFLGLCHGNRRRELLYLYPGKQTLVVQEIFQRQHALRLLFLDREEFGRYLDEQGLLVFEQNWEPIPYVDDTVHIMPGQIQKRSELAEYPWIWLLAEEIDSRSGQMLRHMGIIRVGFRNEIVTEEMEGEECAETREPYEAGRFAEKMLEWMQETG